MSSSQNQTHHQLLRSAESIQHQAARDIIKKASLREPQATGSYRDKLRASYEFQTDGVGSRIEKSDSLKPRSTRSPKKEEEQPGQKVYKTSKDLQNLFRKNSGETASKPTAANESHLKEKIRTMIYDRSSDRVGVAYSQTTNPYRLKLLQESSKKSAGANDSGWLDKTAEKDRSHASAQNKRNTDGLARQRSAYFASNSRDASSSKKEEPRAEADEGLANCSYSRAIYLPSELIKTRKESAIGGKTFSRLYQPDESKGASRSGSRPDASPEAFEEQARKVGLLGLELERMHQASREKDAMMLEIGSEEEKKRLALCQEIERLSRDLSEKEARCRELQESNTKLQAECRELALGRKPERSSADSADGACPDPHETIQVLKETIAVISKDNEKLTRKLLGAKEKMNSALCEKDKIIQTLRSQAEEVVPSVSSKQESVDNSTLGCTSASRGLTSVAGQESAEATAEENKRLVAILAEKESVIEALQEELKNQPARRNVEASPASEAPLEVLPSSLERWAALLDKELSSLAPFLQAPSPATTPPPELPGRDLQPAPRQAGHFPMNRIEEVDEEEESEEASKKGFSGKAKDFCGAAARFEERLRLLLHSLNSIKREARELGRLLSEQDARGSALGEELNRRDELISKMHERIGALETCLDSVGPDSGFARHHTFGQCDGPGQPDAKLTETPKWASEERSFQ